MSEKNAGAYSLVPSRDMDHDAHAVMDPRDPYAIPALRLRKALARFEPASASPARTTRHGTQTRVAAVAGTSDGRISRALNRGTGIFSGDILFGFSVVLGVNMEHLYRYLLGHFDLERLAWIRATFPREQLDSWFRLEAIAPPERFGSTTRKVEK
jgi:hypothetical protein